MDIFNIIQLALMDEFITIIDIKKSLLQSMNKNIIESMNQMMQKTVIFLSPNFLRSNCV